VLTTWIGAAIIAASGLFIFRRQQRLAKLRVVDSDELE
jgi:LPXTG-motif cell wall-anchored protein